MLVTHVSNGANVGLKSEWQNVQLLLEMTAVN